MDIAHEFGGDLSVGPTGDIGLSEGAVLGQQRVLRRLLTNAGDYIWQLPYGAGLPQFVGTPPNNMQIRAVMRSQMFLETTVAAAPEPVIAVSGDAAGTVYVELRYTDAGTSATQLLSFNLGT